MKAKRVEHPIYDLLPSEIKGFDSLAELAIESLKARAAPINSNPITQ
jgi:hypothetical protein